MARKKERPKYEKTYLFLIPSILLISCLFLGASLISKDAATSMVTTFLPVTQPVDTKDDENQVDNYQIIQKTDIPAYTTISTLMEYSPKGLSSPAKNLGGTPYNALTWICNYTTSPAPVAGGEVVFSKEKASVIFQAVGAGQGVQSVLAAERSVSTCAHRDGNGGIYTLNSPISGTEGFIGYTTVRGKTNYVSVWQRGDIIVSIMSPSLSQTQALSSEYDTEVRGILKGVCLSLDVGLKDAQRSPYYSPADYTGWNKGRKVKISTKTPGLHPGMLSTGTEINGAGQPLGNIRNKLRYPINGKTAEVPSWSPATVPVAPLAPFEGELPPAVPQPGNEPVITVERPTSVTIPERLKDLEGPGCGWSFTGQAAPVWDDEVEKKRADGLEKEAQHELREQYKDYLVARAKYLTEWTEYYDQVVAYRKYAKKVKTVAEQWETLNSQRAAYRTILDNYWDSVSAHDNFLEEQKRVANQYEEDIQQCLAEAKEREDELKDEENQKEENPTPSNEPTDPEATDPVTQEPTDDTEQEKSETIEDEDCPPVRPEILDAKAPDILPAPTLPNFLLPDAWKDLLEFR